MGNSLSGLRERKKEAEQEDSTPQKKQSPYALSVWYEPADEETTQFDIVFVHGLTGNSTSTWCAASASRPWPETKLPRSFNRARIMTFGYDADVVRTLGRVSQNTVLDHASNFLNYLRIKRSGPLRETRPLMFVAHSLGGLVCEQTLLLCSQHPEDDVKRIWTSTFGIIFMGTPQLGADLAVVAGRLARIVDLDPTRKVNRKLLEVLRQDSSVLAGMQQSFKSLVANRIRLNGSLAVHSFAEELPVKYIGQVVVTTQSCRFPAAFDDYSTIHADHMEMTKIQETDDNAYELLVGVIQRWLRNEIPHPIPLPDWRLGTKDFYHYPKPIKHFQPRERLLRNLAEAMKTSRTVVLQGLGGSGKSQLAMEYCTQCEIKKTVWAIFWTKASSKASMANSFDEIWDIIRPPRMMQGSGTLAAKIILVKEALSRWDHPWLLVFDNYDDLDEFPGIMDFVPQSKIGRVLFTSRLQGLPQYDGFDREIRVEGLDELVALDMLLSRSKIADLDRTPALKRYAEIIVNRLGRLPLAIDQAAAYISLTEETLDNFTRNFDSIKADVLNILANDLSYVKSTSDGKEARATICSTWELSFKMIKDEVPRTQQIKGYVLTLLAYLDARNISDEIFGQPFTICSRKGEMLFREGLMTLLQTSSMLRGTAWNMNALYLLIGEFTTLSLIQQFQRSEDFKHRIVSLHPLVQDWLKIRASEGDRERCFFLAVCILCGCVAACKRTSAGQQMSLSADGEIQILRHLEALDADSRLAMQSATPGSLFETLQPVIQQMLQTMSGIRAQQLRQLMREIGQWLSALNPDDYHRSILARAASGTGSSVLDNNKFHQWTTIQKPGLILWLVGDPGTGKTFATAAIISYLQNVVLKENRRSGSVLFFYLRDGTDFSVLAREVFGNLLKLLLASQDAQVFLDSEVASIRELYATHRADKPTNELGAILKILLGGVKKLKICYIVIDGLDICPENSTKIFLFQLAPLLRVPRVKLMMTSRLTPFLADYLRNSEALVISFDPGETHSPEKKDYIHNRISVWAMKQSLKERVESFVLHQRHKSFLYLRLLLDEMEGVKSEEEFEQKVDTFPPSLDGFLEHRLSDILKTDDNVRQDSLLMIIWVLCAQAPVPLTALLPIFYPRLDMGGLEGAVSYFRRITGDLIVFDGTLGIPRFAHSSIKEYLQASRLGRTWSSYRSPMGGRWLSTPRFVSQPGPNTGLQNLPYDHATFALECISQLSQQNLNFGLPGPSMEQAQDLSFEYEFLKYAAVYWGEHVTQYHKDLGTEDYSAQEKFKHLTERSVKFLTSRANLKTSLVIAGYLRESGQNKGSPLAQLTQDSTALDVANAFKLPGEIQDALRRA